MIGLEKQPLASSKRSCRRCGRRRRWRASRPPWGRTRLACARLARRRSERWSLCRPRRHRSDCLPIIRPQFWPAFRPGSTRWRCLSAIEPNPFLAAAFAPGARSAAGCCQCGACVRHHQRRHAIRLLFRWRSADLVFPTDQASPVILG